MSTNQTSVQPDVAAPPVPGIKAYATYGAALLMMIYPWASKLLAARGISIPPLDQETAQGIAALLITGGLIFSRMGVKSAAQYILVNLVRVLKPEIEAIIQKELATQTHLLLRNQQLTSQNVSNAVERNSTLIEGLVNKPDVNVGPLDDKVSSKLTNISPR